MVLHISSVCIFHDLASLYHDKKLDQPSPHKYNTKVAEALQRLVWMDIGQEEKSLQRQKEA